MLHLYMHVMFICPAVHRVYIGFRFGARSRKLLWARRQAVNTRFARGFRLKVFGVREWGGVRWDVGGVRDLSRDLVRSDTTTL
jgi:hypothetical protein